MSGKVQWIGRSLWAKLTLRPRKLPKKRQTLAQGFSPGFTGRNGVALKERQKMGSRKGCCTPARSPSQGVSCQFVVPGLTYGAPSGAQLMVAGRSSVDRLQRVMDAGGRAAALQRLQTIISLSLSAFTRHLAKIMRSCRFQREGRQTFNIFGANMNDTGPLL